jgi:hypothetical protein
MLDIATRETGIVTVPGARNAETCVCASVWEGKGRVERR